MKLFTTIVLMFSLAGSAFASKEGLLAFSSFRVESTSIGSSGKIVVAGQQNEESQITALTISAFGNDYAVPKGKLAKLAGLPSNGIRISYEQGYPQLGGRTVYVQLQVGFTSFTRKEAVITLTENGKIEVSEIQIKKEPNQAAEPLAGAVVAHSERRRYSLTLRTNEPIRMRLGSRRLYDYRNETAAGSLAGP